MKKHSLYILFLILLLLLSQNVVVMSGNDIWTKMYDSENYSNMKGRYEVWKLKKYVYYRSVVENKVSLGGTILKTYGYTQQDIEDKNDRYFNKQVLKKEYKEFYPIFYTKLKYIGCDNQGNIKIKIIPGKTDSNNLAKIYTNINEFMSAQANGFQSINMVFTAIEMSQGYNKEKSQEYLVDSNKVIVLNDTEFPPFKVSFDPQTTNITVNIFH